MAHQQPRHYFGRAHSALTATIVLITVAVAVTVLVSFLPALATHPDPVRLAEEWLSHIDTNRYSDSWATASSYLKQQIQEGQWTRTLTSHRQPFGPVLSRQHHKTERRHHLPNVPKGEYAVLYFATSFTHKRDALETVVMFQESNGLWKAIGYTIK